MKSEPQIMSFNIKLNDLLNLQQFENNIREETSKL